MHRANPRRKMPLASIGPPYSYSNPAVGPSSLNTATNTSASRDKVARTPRRAFAVRLMHPCVQLVSFCVEPNRRPGRLRRLAVTVALPGGVNVSTPDIRQSPVERPLGLPRLVLPRL